MTQRNTKPLTQQDRATNPLPLEAQHTPGPWTYELARWAPEAPVGGFSIKAIGKKPAICRAGVSEQYVLTIPEDFRHYPQWAKEFYTEAELEANARLIASAPALLEALRKLVQDIRDFEEIYPIQLGSLGLSTRIEFLAAEKAIRDAEGKI